MRLIVLLLTTLALVSCSAVESVQVVGAKPVDLTAHRLEGVWSDSDGEELALVLKDRKRGAFAVFCDEEENEILVRETEGVLFVSIKDEDAPRFSWARLRLRGDRLHVDVPDPETFATLVERGRVDGRILEAAEILDDDGAMITPATTTVVLDDPEGAWVHQLAAGQLGNPWRKDEGMVLKRVRDLD